MVKKKAKATIKLDLSFGELPEGFAFTRVPKLDPMKFPWPLADGSVEEVYCAYMLNRVPAKLRPHFLDELWRVLVAAGKATIIVPYWSNARAVQDPYSEWPPIVEQSFLYFNKDWREQNKLPYKFKCDFDFQYGYTLDPETGMKTDDARPFWVKHYVNAVQDLQVVLTKR